MCILIQSGYACWPQIVKEGSETSRNALSTATCRRPYWAAHPCWIRGETAAARASFTPVSRSHCGGQGRCRARARPWAESGHSHQGLGERAPHCL